MASPISSPFFATPVSFKCKRRENNTLRTFEGTVLSVCVDDGESDISDAVTQRTIRMRSYFIRRNEWIDGTPPQAGDVIETQEGDKFAVEKVSELMILGWNCTAREI